MLPRVKRARVQAQNGMLGQMAQFAANPQMMGVNPLLASMFGQMGMNAMNHMMGMPQQGQGSTVPTEEDDGVDEGQVPSSADSAPEEPELPPAIPAVVNDDVHQRCQDALISRSVTYLKQLPRQRLSECLEMVYPGLDAVLTAQLSVNGLLCVLWTYTRMVPSVKISDIRALICIWHGLFCFVFAQV